VVWALKNARLKKKFLERHFRTTESFGSRPGHFQWTSHEEVSILFLESTFRRHMVPKMDKREPADENIHVTLRGQNGRRLVLVNDTGSFKGRVVAKKFLQTFFRGVLRQVANVKNHDVGVVVVFTSGIVSFQFVVIRLNCRGKLGSGSERADTKKKTLTFSSQNLTKSPGGCSLRSKFLRNQNRFFHCRLESQSVSRFNFPFDLKKTVFE
jgi:hypothetical protein